VSCHALVIRQRPTHHLIRLLTSHRIYLHYIYPLSPSLRTAELVNACEQVWHKTCLKCEKCNKQLANGGFLEKDSKWAALACLMQLSLFCCVLAVGCSTLCWMGNGWRRLSTPDRLPLKQRRCGRGTCSADQCTSTRVLHEALNNCLPCNALPVRPCVGLSHACHHLALWPRTCPGTWPATNGCCKPRFSSRVQRPMSECLHLTPTPSAIRSHLLRHSWSMLSLS
jgi:hypothetical protein